MNIKFKKKSIVINKKPVFIFSGEIDSYKLPSDLWLDRFEKIKAMGLNCIGVYFGWNFHSPSKNRYDFKSFPEFPN
ncbi:MAG: beta-galactosidase [Candidatus Omnitrophica bacterium]|nr:beta-galactosidase [Candidatus Omnitrophota bacterium]